MSQVQKNNIRSVVLDIEQIVNHMMEVTMYKRLLFTSALMLCFIGTVTAQKMTVKDSDNHVLMEVNDEGSVGSITLPQGSSVSEATNKLYNLGGLLYWSGNKVAMADDIYVHSIIHVRTEHVGNSSYPEQLIFTASDDITITDIYFEPSDDFTTSDEVNYHTFVIFRRDADATNKVTVASITTSPSGTGNWTKFVPESWGSLINTSLSAGQKLSYEIIVSGVGEVTPSFMIVIEYTYD